MFNTISEKKSKESTEARVEALSHAVLDEVTNLTAGTVYGFIDRALEVNVVRSEKSGRVIGWELLLTTGGPRVVVRVFPDGWYFPDEWSNVVVSEMGYVCKPRYGFTPALVEALVQLYSEEYEYATDVIEALDLLRMYGKQ